MHSTRNPCDFRYATASRQPEGLFQNLHRLDACAAITTYFPGIYRFADKSTLGG